MALQFDNEDSLRAQRMTADEARSVIALWQQEREEQAGLTNKPAVPDVAEGLGLPVADVQRLLAEVRVRRVEEEVRLAQEQAEFRLAEEERKLNEVRWQRAQLERQMADVPPLPAEPAQVQWSEQLQRETHREPTSLKTMREVTVPEKAVKARMTRKPFAIEWPVPVLIISILVVIWLISMAYHQNMVNQHPDTGGCTTALPNGTTHPCPP